MTPLAGTKDLYSKTSTNSNYSAILVPMTRHTDTSPASMAALASPQRLELIGLFVDADRLSIADMAARVGRPATSLYHHVAVLEEAGVVKRAGTRPKGKRFETLYELTRPIVDVDVDDKDTLRRAMTAALRMAERDFAEAIERDDVVTEGPERQLQGYRVHVRASGDVLARLNERLQAVEDLFRELATQDTDPGPDDEFVSLTVLLAPLRGRQADRTPGGSS
jgi:DNA-binding transcriptional ArsR family regulator